MNPAIIDVLENFVHQLLGFLQRGLWFNLHGNEISGIDGGINGNIGN